MKSLWEHFCKHSSLHGVQYLVGKTDKSYLSKLLWSLLLVFITVVLIVNTYYMWLAVHQGPVLVVVDNPSMSLKTIEFPAVIVCPKTKILKRKVSEIIKNYKFDRRNSSAFKHSLLALSLMKFPDYNLPQDYLDMKNKSVFNIPSEDIEGIMREVSANVDQVMTDCSWLGAPINCSEVFRKHVTVEGFCFVFNSKQAYISRDGEKQLIFYEPFKKRIETQNDVYGRDNGLTFVLKPLADEQLADDLEGDSYNILTTNPYTHPDPSYSSTVLPGPPSKQVLISVSVSKIEAHASLNNLEVPVRGCLFFKFQNGSRIPQCDCKTNMIFEMCKCLPFYLHHSKCKTVCGLEHLKCLRRINPFLRNYGVPKSTPGFPSWTQPITYDCFCPPLCDYTIYSPQVRVIKLSGSNSNNKTNVEVYFEYFAVKYSRTVSYEMRDFVVGLGSTAGLFIGFNTLAVCDIVMLICKFLTGCFCRICTIKKLKQFSLKKNKKRSIKLQDRTVLFQRRCEVINKKSNLNWNPKPFNDKPNTGPRIPRMLRGTAEPCFPFVH